jgi:uncharacterized protein (TIGR02246 family)
MQEIFKEALDARDLERIMALYEPDAAFVLESGEVVRGIDAIRPLQEQFIATEPEFEHEIQSVVEGPGIAVVYTNWTLRGQGPEGPVELSGRTTDVVRRQPDGTWKLVIDNPWGRNS